jgi:6-phosphogluconate dehydrogenase
VQQIGSIGAAGVSTLASLIKRLEKPRAVWIMLPAGAPVAEAIQALLPHLSPGDTLIDGGNSHYKDAIRRAEELRRKEIPFLDVGTSGGIRGRSIGYCLMIGGEEESFKKMEPLFETLSPPDGYLYCGSSGAGHFAKMVHNGIEYAMLEAYGEGFELLRSSPFGFDFGRVAHLWNRGSIIRSWLLELGEEALTKDPTLGGIKGYVEDSGEGRWTVQEAVERGARSLQLRPRSSIVFSPAKRIDSQISSSPRFERRLGAMKPKNEGIDEAALSISLSAVRHDPEGALGWRKENPPLEINPFGSIGRKRPADSPANRHAQGPGGP